MSPGLVAAAKAVADELLRPHAEQVDRDGVPRSHLQALAQAGLFGITSPREYGGSDVALAEARAVHETLAAADASTWFVFTQHHTPVRTLVRGDNGALRERWLPALARGETVAGTAFTQLRRPGPPSLTATPDGDGWRLDGDIAWLTSWELAGIFLIGAQHGADVVWALTRLDDPATAVAAPLDLAAMSATRTVSVRLRGLPVAAEDVVLVEPLADWRVLDAARTIDTGPAVFGVTREAADRLVAGGDEDGRQLGHRLHEELATVRDEAYRLADADAPVEDRLRVRATAHALSVRATAALVAAGGGRSMLATAPAQRLAGEALFLLVQGQTAAVRAATLSGWSG